MIDVIHPTSYQGRDPVRMGSSAVHRGLEILAIGDNHNDLEMLSFAGVPVVMENWCAGAEDTRVARDPVE